MNEETDELPQGFGVKKRGPLGPLGQETVGETRPNIGSALMEQERVISMIEEQFSALYTKLVPILQPTPADPSDNVKMPATERVMDVLYAHNRRLEEIVGALRHVTKNLDV